MAAPLTPEACAALEAKIADLKARYEDIISGQNARTLVDQNGERVEFSAANLPRLLNYINSLEKQYSEGCLLKKMVVSRPILPFF